MICFRSVLITIKKPWEYTPIITSSVEGSFYVLNQLQKMSLPEHLRPAVDGSRDRILDVDHSELLKCPLRAQIV